MMSLCCLQYGMFVVTRAVLWIDVCSIVPSQPNGVEEIYAMDQLSKFEQDKMKEVNKDFEHVPKIDNFVTGDAWVDEEHYQRREFRQVVKDC